MAQTRMTKMEKILFGASLAVEAATIIYTSTKEPNEVYVGIGALTTGALQCGGLCKYLFRQAREDLRVILNRRG